MKIPFNSASLTKKELEYITEVLRSGKISGNGIFSKKCTEFIQNNFGIKQAFLTTSGTAALEAIALLLDLEQGDEVIMPSFTYPSTANAFLLRGAVPRFCDIRNDTLNLDENLIEALINENTKALVPVHYAGTACEMDTICALTKQYKLALVEDAAHGIGGRYKDRFLGSMGDMAAFSFHETKNIISGEGGALLINDPRFISRAKVLLEGGTNRDDFLKGKVSEYVWMDLGISIFPSEINAGMLWAQLEQMKAIQRQRDLLWERYYNALKDIAGITVAHIPDNINHNSHIFYILLDSKKERDDAISHLTKKGIQAVFHYIPLHLSPMGQKLGYKHGDLPVTEDIAARIVRLPLYNSMSVHQQDHVIDELIKFKR